MWKRSQRYDPEAARERVDAALETIKAGVVALKTSEDWTRMLDFQSKFHHYSFGNVMWITLQMPTATQVAGFHAWKKVGRWVKAGETALYVLAPMGGRTRTVREIDPGTGEEIDVQYRQPIRGFRLVPVFDISQTDGEPTPTITHLLMGRDERLQLVYTDISAWLASNGYKLEVSTEPGAAGGFIRQDVGLIVINEERDPDHQCKTLIHEVAHLLLHTPVEYQRIAHQKGLGKRDVPRDAREIEAESVAYVVLNAIGFDSAPYSFGYVAHWSGGDVEAVGAVADRVRQCAHIILDSVLGVGGAPAPVPVPAPAPAPVPASVDVRGTLARMLSSLPPEARRSADNLLRKKKWGPVDSSVATAIVQRAHWYENPGPDVPRGISDPILAAALGAW
jgi:hypothetical protein